MYNEEYKKEYLEYNTNAELGTQIFILSEEYESKYQKDLYDFTVEQILGFYKMMGTLSVNRIYQVNHWLNNYTSNALSKNLVKDGQNHFDELKMEVLVTCLDHKGIDSTVITHDELKIYCAKLVNPRDKYLFCALYDGLLGHEFEEITELKLDDINVETKTAILCTGREVEISPELIMYARESTDTYEYYTYLLKNGLKQIHGKYKIVGDDIWKIIKRGNTNDTQHNRGKQCAKNIIKFVDYLDLPKGYITAKSLRNSGCVNYINKLAENHGVTGKDVLYDTDGLFKEVTKQYQLNISSRVNFYRKYRDHLKC